MISDAASYQSAVKNISLKYGLIALCIDRKFMIFRSTLDFLLEPDLIATFPSIPDKEWDYESIEQRIVEGCVLNGF